MPIRHNILDDAQARQQYIDGCLLLNREPAGLTSADVGAGGPAVPLTTWDLFVLWHYFTMNTPTPPGSTRNAAHRGPVFLPWHRWMLLLLESQLQRVLGDSTFGLPYWDWAADGDHAPDEQPLLPIWTLISNTGDGPFAFDAANPQSFRVRIAENVFSGALDTVNRGLRRQLGDGDDLDGLPSTPQVEAALARTRYDRPDYDSASTASFRNEVEGWVGAPIAGLHNRVHVWVGGDMGPGTSPNDPVFYLNHCNEDRIWEVWMQRRGRIYEPPADAADDLFRHRLGDELLSMLTTQQPLISDMLDLSTFAPPARVPIYDVLS